MNIPPGKLRDWLDARLGSDGLDAVMFLMNHMVIWNPPRCNVAHTRLGDQIGYVSRDSYNNRYNWSRTPDKGCDNVYGHAETIELAMEALEREWWGGLNVPLPRVMVATDPDPVRLTDLMADGGMQ